MGTLANSDDQDAMLQNVAFHQGIYFFPRETQFSGTEVLYILICKVKPLTPWYVQ